jgi:tRNA(His) 5'-end guanylyltransferase
MGLFQHSNHRERQLSDDLFRLRLDLIAERRISELLHSVIIAYTESEDYVELLYQALNAYAKRHSKPITGK